MVLVDTSVFIPFLRNQDAPETRALDRIIEDRIPFGISPYIYQELLQGVKTPAEFSILKDYLETQRIYDLTQGSIHLLPLPACFSTASGQASPFAGGLTC
jgi:predicted nucleic acid-binding protein